MPLIFEDPDSVEGVRRGGGGACSGVRLYVGLSSPLRTL